MSPFSVYPAFILLARGGVTAVVHGVFEFI